jgi:Tfp pilus assembly protein PilX
MIKRFARDESGMTLALAMIMIVVIGVMGAGLLTFAGTNLQTVAEVNRGQRGFEVADAGVEVAKRHRANHCAADPNCAVYYDDREDRQIEAADNQWSVINGGVTLNDLDMDNDVGGRADSVNVTIDRRHLTNDYLITSTGTYGEAGEEARRKIEAILKGVNPNNVGEGSGHPIYYTPSAITIETDPALGGITLDDISMFSEQDILLEGPTTPDQFIADYNDPNAGTIKIDGGNPEELGNWNSMDARYFDNPAPFNTRPRLKYTVRGNGSVVTSDFLSPGFAAEGEVCGFTETVDPEGSCESVRESVPATQSIADGVSSYDSTTGSFAPDGVTQNTNPRPVNPAQAQKCTFMAKPFPTNNPNNPCYITYPFPRPEPPPEKLKLAAEEADTETDRRYWNVATEGTPDWNALFPGCTDPDGNCLDRLVFVDAGAADAPLEYQLDSSRRAQGVMVVWCGDLQLNQTFKGVIFNLYGDGSAFGASNCADDQDPLTTDDGPATNGVFRNNGEFCQCWLYAQGGSPERAGIEIGPGSTVKFLPGVEWSFKEFLDDVLDNNPPTQFEVRSWRELYE